MLHGLIKQDSLWFLRKSRMIFVITKKGATLKIIKES